MSIRTTTAIALFFFFSARVAYAQQPSSASSTAQGKILDFKSCTWTNFCLDCGSSPAGLVNGTPDDWLRQNIDDKKLKKLKGTLLIQVMIDSTGHACCPRIQNFTYSFNSDIEKLKIDSLISNTQWKLMQQGPAKSRVAASLIMLKANFAGKQGYTIDYYRPKLKF